jgi:hypothetical protein
MTSGISYGTEYNFINSLDGNWRLSIARRFGVDYFVMERSRLRETLITKVYENEGLSFLMRGLFAE